MTGKRILRFIAAAFEYRRETAAACNRFRQTTEATLPVNLRLGSLTARTLPEQTPRCTVHILAVPSPISVPWTCVTLLGCRYPETGLPGSRPTLLAAAAAFGQ